jgi:hypothetical protein
MIIALFDPVPARRRSLLFEDGTEPTLPPKGYHLHSLW